MDVSVKKAAIEGVLSDFIVSPFTEEQAKKVNGTGLKALVKGLVDDGDFKGEMNEIKLLRPGSHAKSKRMLLLGLGKEKKISQEVVRKAYSNLVKAVEHYKMETFSSSIPDLKIDKKLIVQGMVEGVVLGNYKFEKYKEKKKDKKEVKRFEVLTSEKDDVSLSNDVKKVKIVCDSVCFVRDIVNESGSKATPEMVAGIASNLARNNKKLTVKVLEEAQLKRLGMDCFLAVGNGSSRPPKFVILEYSGKGKGEKPIALVGKGITFDSGGLNLKPTGYIETMKDDKAGAVTVMGTLKAVAELDLKVNVVGIMPLAENMIGPKSYQPGDIIKSYGGKTIEIGNTDAEGRLILIDALAYAQKVFKPRQIIDLATLTGMILYTFGDVVAGLFSNDKKLAKSVFGAGERTFERVWELPIYEEYSETMKGVHSDLSNTGDSKYAGSITAAAFLKEFVKSPWVHLDIAGTAFNEKGPKNYTPKGGTGWGVRLLVDLLSSGKVL